MRNDDQLRHFTPLLRRIVVIVALLTAAPVILWTITAFVRSYVGPPHIPSYRRLAAAPSVQPAENRAADQADGDPPNPPPAAAQMPTDPAAPAPTVEARATMPDSPGAPPAPNAPANLPALTATIPTVVTDAEAKPADRFADRVVPDRAMPTGALTSNAPAAAELPTADPMPAAEPLHGPIPLPRQRPRIFAMAQVTAAPATPPMGAPTGAPRGVPMPRPRPEAAGPQAAVPEPPSHGPLDFIQGLFQQ